MNTYKSFLQILFCSLAAILSGQDTTVNISSASVDTIISSGPQKVEVTSYSLHFEGSELLLQSQNASGIATFTLNGEEKDLRFQDGQASLDWIADAKGNLLLLKPENGTSKLFHISKSNSGAGRIVHIPLWLSIIPPLIAIGLALIFKEVVISLFAGIWAGAFIAGGMRLDSIYYFLISILEVVQKYMINALNDTGHLSVIVFSLLIGGMVAVISRNGGMAGVVNKLSRYATNAKSSQLVTWLLGVAIFFDDYANTLIVGNTMRPVTDKFRISREKLAYIVDSTAAPVAAVAFITTWIGAELGYIDSGLKVLEGLERDMTPYAVFLHSLKYSFYPVFTLIFILILIYTKRDFGPMHAAEIRARTTGEVARKNTELGEQEELEDLSPVKGAPHRWYNAFIPVILVILVTIFGLIDTGIANSYSELTSSGLNVASASWGDVWASLDQLLQGDNPSFFRKLGKLIGNADSFVALLWASLAGIIAALLLTLSARIMKLTTAINTTVTGFKTMLPALIILTLAWSLAATTEELHTAEYLTRALGGWLDPLWLPVVVFVLAALISFSTGSSWSTMAILYPIAIPTTWAISIANGYDHDHSLELLFNVISVTLSASVLGDHCSPISDTTILSSLASDCNHIDHVRTQMPYALSVGALSLACGGLSTALGGSWTISISLLLIGILLMYLLVKKVGKPVEQAELPFQE